MDDKESRLLLTRARFATVSVTIIVFLLTWLAVEQDSHPDPLRPMNWLRMETYSFPIETNGFLRMPMVEPEMRRLHTLRGTRHVWAVGRSPIVLHSSDAGVTWRALDVRRRNDGSRAVAMNANHDGMWLSSVFFADPARGWAGGQAGLFATKDGGEHWTCQLAEPIDDFAISGNYGIAIGRKVHLSEDGGRTWTESEPPPFRAGRAVAMVPGSGHNARVVTLRGEVWRTSNGKEWRRNGSPNEALAAAHWLRFTDESNGEVLTPSALLVTNDGGESWRRYAHLPRLRPPRAMTLFEEIRRTWKSPPADQLLMREHDSLGTKRSLLERFTSSRYQAPLLETCRASGVIEDFVAVEGRQTLVIADGQICRSSTVGATWQPVTAPREFVSAIHVRRDGEELWTAGGGGVILFSDDGGETWEPRNSGVTTDLQAITFVGNSDRGWAAGNGILLKTEDGGDAWTLAATFESDLPLTTVHFSPDGQTGVAHGELSSHAYVTRDGGRRWQPLQIDGTVDSPIHFVNHLRGWVLAGYPTSLLQTQDGGKTWSATKFNELYSSMFFNADGTRGWLGTHSLPVMRTFDGIGFHRVEGRSDTWVRSFTFSPNGRYGWAADNRGQLFTTTDRGDTWNVSRNARALRPETIAFTRDGSRAWAATEEGVPLRSLDGGQTWMVPRYRRSPGVWLYVTIAMVAAVFGGSFLTDHRRRRQREIGEAASNDAPIASANDDKLGFTAVANGLARLLGNSRTEPPFTIAINAAWGRGKTSFARLISRGVRAYDFQPVWFNAWHYQEEEHLLGALIEALRRDAIPAFWTPAGLQFRVQLLYLRVHKHMVAALVVLAVLAVSVDYFLSTDGALQRAAGALVDWESIISGENRKPTGFLVAGAIAVTAIIRGLAAFGVTRTHIGAFLLSGFRLADAGSPGFRHRFAQSFRDATMALGDRRIVLIIDDLDRCSPEQVMSMLDTVNFLTDAGACYVVLAADLRHVERCVAIQREDERARMVAIDRGLVSDPLADARHYLEKLINLQVPLPPSSEQQSRALLVEPVPEPETTRRIAFASKEVIPWLRGFVPTIVIWMVVFGMTTGMMTWLSRPRPAPSYSAEIQPQSDTDRHRPRASAYAAAMAPPSSPQYEARVLLPEEPATTVIWLTVVIGAAVLALVIFLVVRFGRSPQEHDSPQFTRAVAVWHALLYRAAQTPRSMKRCVNRIRYYAMLQRENDLPPGRLHTWILVIKAFIDALFDNEKDPAESFADPDDTPFGKPTGRIPPEVLVPLGMLQHVHPEWLEYDAFWDDTFAFLARHRKVLGDILEQPEVRDAMPFAPYREIFTSVATAS